MGHNNNIAGEQLRQFIDRFERIDADKAALTADRKVVTSELVAAGFDSKIVAAILKRRKANPNAVQEADALMDLYMHALGMSTEPPLFRAASMAGSDKMARDALIEAMKSFVPENGKGDITVNIEGKPVRLSRNKTGEVEVVDVVESPPAPAAGTTSLPSAVTRREPPPDVDDAGAEELGRQARKDNKPVIENPFPFGDARRPIFDRGWRKEDGGDGMGPKED